MLNYFKRYREWVGGKWYKVVVYNTPFFYYTKTKPSKINHWVVKKYRY
jgi:hypothetical protein